MKIEYSLDEENYDLIEEAGFFLITTSWWRLDKSPN
jgi:hypothetical protein